MQWTIKLEITPDGGGTISHEIGTITRPIGDLKSEEIGLTLAEGHELVRDIERRMISDQIHIYMFCFRRCTYWPGRAMNVKSAVFEFGFVRSAVYCPGCLSDLAF